MKKTRQFFLIIATFCAMQSLFSQDLHIHYDAQTEEIKYLIGGQEVRQPKVKKGSNVFLHIDNYNNYLYDVEIEVNDKMYEIGDNSQNLLGALSPGGISLSSFFGNMDSGIENGGDEEFGGFGFGDNSAAWQEINQLKVKFDNLAIEMGRTESQLRAIQQSVQEYQTAQEIKNLVVEEVRKIKYNPSFNPEQIKKLTTAYLKKGLEVNSITELDLDVLLTRNDQKTHLGEKLSALKNAHQKYSEQTKSLAAISVLLNEYSMSDEDFIQFKYTIDEIYNKAQVIENNANNQEVELEELLEQAKSGNMDVLTAMHYEYEAIANNKFSHVYRTEANSDLTELKLTFQRKDSLGFSGAKEEITVAPIRVPVFGGIKISTSVGISFGQYFERPQSYFIRDATILGEDKDSFYPILSSFFHFYSQSAGNTNFGGAFGIGVPLTGADGIQSAVFFLGPSVIFGKEQRFAFTAGLMGGKVEGLSQGYEVGDVVGYDVLAVPLKYPYELGAFLGLSFNLGQ